MVQTLLAHMENNKIVVQITNTSDVLWEKKPGEILGFLDARSLGYFHVSRDMLQRYVESSFKDHVSLLSEQETDTYFEKLNDDHRELVHFAQQQVAAMSKSTKLVHRDTPVSDGQPNDDIDPWPWLEPDDPRRNMTDREILEKYVNLEDSDLTPEEKKELMKVLLKYKQAFSLRDEIGMCPHMEVELELNDVTPFFIRPFPIKESEKDFVDKEMRKGVLLGILRKGMSSYSSPIMLIPRKLSGIPRIVTDFRHLNTRLVTLQPSIPLVRDAIQILGSSECEVLSLADLRDAYHTLRLSRKSQRYCGITPYYGSDTYLYQRLGMGLSVSPAIWQNFIQSVLSEIPSHRRHHLAIMDDCLVHSKKSEHMKHLIDLFKALVKNGLKMSPRKCQLFKTKLVYMGIQIIIEDKIPTIVPMKSKIDAIVNLDPPTCPKHCKSFCGMVNFISIWLPSLQKKLIPIYELTKKGKPFVWGDEQQAAFQDIKHDVTNAPVLVMPNNTGHFVLVSDTSKEACGAALYQFQKGQYRLVGYCSKKLPDSAQRYSISELELTGIMCNVAAFKHVLRNTEFTVYCDHSALVHIVQAKREPPTLRLKKLIEHLSDYKFTIKFCKGKEMHISDFLSRHPDNDMDPTNEVIPISFLLKDLGESLAATRCRYISERFEDEVYRIDSVHCTPQERNVLMDVLNIVTRSMTKAAQAEVPPMYPLHGEHRKPEWAKSDIIQLPTEVPQSEVERVEPKRVTPEIGIQDTGILNELPDTDAGLEPVIQDVIPPVQGVKDQDMVLPPFYKGGTVELPPKQPVLPPIEQFRPNPLMEPTQLPRVKQNLQTRYEGLLNPLPIDIELRGRLPAYDVDKELKQYPFDLELPTIQELNQQKKKLFHFIPEDTIYRKHIPKQIELAKFMDSLKEKVIHDYNIPIAVKELRAEYKHSPYFRDILKYITTGYCKFVGKAQKLFKMQCEDFLVMDGVLFKIRYAKEMKGEPTLVLCVPEKYVPTILYQYHAPLLAGHPGVMRLYETVRKKYYFPAMLTLVRQFVQSCIECQTMKGKEDTPQVHYPRIPLDTRPMARLSMDIKDMPTAMLGFKHILVCTCEFTNWVEAIPIVNQEAATIAEAFFFRVICKYGTPRAVICDEGPAFTSQLMRMYFHAMNIKPYYISPMNHGSNRTERYIRTLSDILCKNLAGTGCNWPLFVLPSCWAMNTLTSHVTGYSPYEMVYHQKPPDLFNFDYFPDTAGLSVATKTYLELMKNRKEVMDELIKNRKINEKETLLINEKRKFPDATGFAVGDLVLIHHPYASNLQSGSKKLARNWVGPLRIQAVLDDTHYLCSDWLGKLIPKKFHINRLKQFYLNLGELDEEGMLKVVENTRQLFQNWSKVTEDE